MYLNFSNFRGRTSAGGTSLGPKTGTSVGWGDWQNFRWMGGPPSPPRKITLHDHLAKFDMGAGVFFFPLPNWGVMKKSKKAELGEWGLQNLFQKNKLLNSLIK